MKKKPINFPEEHTWYDCFERAFRDELKTHEAMKFYDYVMRKTTARYSAYLRVPKTKRRVSHWVDASCLRFKGDYAALLKDVGLEGRMTAFQFEQLFISMHRSSIELTDESDGKKSFCSYRPMFIFSQSYNRAKEIEQITIQLCSIFYPHLSNIEWLPANTEVIIHLQFREWVTDKLSLWEKKNNGLD